jgi:NADPH-dependent 2,4-dienoyl-CoA reductase/sulfur reductase-like enzyme/pSer/pThr/pTyr-binding forkhead associated (FHA) protein
MGTEQTSYVIIGNGIAGISAAETLRSEDSAAVITVVADDPFPVYYRPALKDYLAGRVQESKLWARSTDFYQQQKIGFLRERAVAIQPSQHSIHLQSGRNVAYSRLLLAPGTRASMLTCSGLDLVGVSTLRTVADYQRVISRLSGVRRVVVSGSGTLALETIETLRHRGYQVTHLIRSKQLWSEVLDQTASDLVQQQEQRDGVDIRLQEEIAEIRGSKDAQSGFQQVREVVTTSGARIPCEMVIIAIGVEPNIDFIKRSGIICGRGVRVDTAMQTSVADIYAAGDVLETTDALTGRTRVVGQWYPAVQQARAAAYSMLNLLDTRQPFSALTFYNATFLYGLPFAAVGLTKVPTTLAKEQNKGYREIVADPQPRLYRKVILKDGIPVGMLALGDRNGTMALKRAIDHGINLSAVEQYLAEPSFKLDEWLDQQGVPPPVLGVRRAGDSDMHTIAYTGTHHPTLITESRASTEGWLVPIINEKSDRALLVEVRLSQTRVIAVGRKEGVYLCIDHPSVSREHAEIRYANGQYFIRNLSRTNPTSINGVALNSGHASILNPDDMIQFGKDIAFVFEERLVLYDTKALSSSYHQAIVSGQSLIDALPVASKVSSSSQISKTAGQTATVSVTPAPNASYLQENPTLVLKAPHETKSIKLAGRKPLMLGRDRKADVQLSDVTISRLHAEIFRGSDGFYIRDLGSSNGVTVNQTRIDNPYLLSNGDRIGIGRYVIEFVEGKNYAR